MNLPSFSIIALSAVLLTSSGEHHIVKQQVEKIVGDYSVVIQCTNQLVGEPIYCTK